MRGGAQLGQPAFVDPVGGRRDRQPGHQPMLIVVDACGHAAHPQLQFFVVPCHAQLAALVQFALECRQLGEAVARVAGQPGAGGIGAQPLGLFVGQEQFPDRSEVQRCPAADGPDHLHARALAVGAFHIDDLVALADAQVDRLLYLFVQFPHGRQGSVAHAESGFDQVAQFQQAHAQPVAAGLGAIDKAADGEIVQDPVGGRGVKAGLFADFLQRNRLLAGGQHLEQVEHAFDHLHSGHGRCGFSSFVHGLMT